MNFEVRGGKVYKEPACQSLGSNWERIERLLGLGYEPLDVIGAATGKELKGGLR
jgi:hypothetical protein